MTIKIITPHPFHLLENYCHSVLKQTNKRRGKSKRLEPFRALFGTLRETLPAFPPAHYRRLFSEFSFELRVPNCALMPASPASVGRSPRRRSTRNPSSAQSPSSLYDVRATYTPKASIHNPGRNSAKKQRNTETALTHIGLLRVGLVIPRYRLPSIPMIPIGVLSGCGTPKSFCFWFM